MELREENEMARYYSLNRLYHEELGLTKRMVKDYEGMSVGLRGIMCEALEVVGFALGKSMRNNMNF